MGETNKQHSGEAWTTNSVTKIVWDGPPSPRGIGFGAAGWLLVADPPSPSVASEDLRLDGLDSDALVRTYTWGLDLSGTFQGAGGIGGLLMVDDAEGDSIAAHYEYDPYGRKIVATGAYADDNPWRFSTKYLDTVDPGDPDASLLYYGYRYLSPRLGRWMSRDPAGEEFGFSIVARGYAGLNATMCCGDLADDEFGSHVARLAYGFVGNHPPDCLDLK